MELLADGYPVRTPATHVMPFYVTLRGAGLCSHPVRTGLGTNLYAVGPAYAWALGQDFLSCSREPFNAKVQCDLSVIGLGQAFEPIEYRSHRYRHILMCH